MRRKDSPPARLQRQVAPGIVERHTVGCGYAPNRRRCTCTPVYRARVRAGARGEQRSVTRTFATEQDAREWVEQAREAARSGRAIPMLEQTVSTVTLGEAAGGFLRRALDGDVLTRQGRRYSVNTIHSYESALRLHALPHVVERYGRELGDLPVGDVDTRTMQGMVNGIAAGRSASLARVAEAAVFVVLRDLYDRGVLDVLPSRPVLPSAPPARKARATVDQVERMAAAADADDAARGRSLMGPLVALLAYGGLRISEALSLTWGPDGVDLDHEQPRVTVQRAGTKTDAGARTIGLDAQTAARLRRHRLATGRPADGRLVFSREDGSRLGRSGRVRGGLRRVYAAAGVDPPKGSRGSHLLRHTSGSMLADAGVGGHDIAARLGHADAGFTARTYVHADRGRLGDAPAALERLREQHRARSG